VTTMPGLTTEERRFREDHPVKVLKGEKKRIMNRKRTWDEIHGNCEVPQRYNEDLALGA
jgi:hypothetical protein